MVDLITKPSLLNNTSDTLYPQQQEILYITWEHLSQSENNWTNENLTRKFRYRLPSR